MVNVSSETSGVHNGGAVSVIYTFPVNGEMAVGQIVVPYTGMFPSHAAVQDKVRVETGCKTAVVVSAVNVDQAFRETNYTCPKAQFVGGVEAPTQAKYANNHYDEARATTLGDAIAVKAKILGMRQFELQGGNPK